MPSVVSCTLHRVQGTTTFDEKNFGHYSLKYDVVTDAVMGHRALAIAALTAGPHPLPSWGQSYSYQGDTDGTSYAQRFGIESKFGEDAQTYYTITVNFEPLDPDRGDNNQFEPNPFDRPPIVWADRETFTRIIEKDQFGDAIVNKCGRQYDIPYEEEDSRGVLVVEFNVASLDTVIEYQQFLRRATNSTAWTIVGVTIPERTAIAREVAASPPVTEGDYTYYHMTFRFVFAEDGKTWDVPFLERGYQYFTKTDDEFDLDDDGNKALSPSGGEPEPVNLAADGTKLPDGEEGVFTDWRVRREVNFNLLPFSG
jgi:hypothetical protein